MQGKMGSKGSKESGMLDGGVESTVGGTAMELALHSEAIWGVMIALVFFAIFEPHDENKS